MARSRGGKKTFICLCLPPHQNITSLRSKQMSIGTKKTNFQAEFTGGSLRFLIYIPFSLVGFVLQQRPPLRFIPEKRPENKKYTLLRFADQIRYREYMSEQITELIDTIATQARDASRGISAATTAQKNQALEAIARELESNRKVLTEENEKDLQGAKEMD